MTYYFTIVRWGTGARVKLKMCEDTLSSLLSSYSILSIEDAVVEEVWDKEAPDCVLESEGAKRRPE